MKIRHHFTTLALATLLLSSCSEETPDAFLEINGIYFNNRANASAASALLDNTDVTFVYENSDEMEVPVKIQLTGRPSAINRPIEVVVTSENAIKGIDYTLPLTAELPAGATELNYIVTLKRTDALKAQTKSVRLEIQANSYFSLPVTHEVQANGESVSTLHYEIFFSDQFTNPPAAWRTDLLREFTQQKFELICRVLSVEPADFNDSNKMTLSKQLYISVEMNNYVRREIEKRDRGENFDPKVLDEVTGEALTF